MFGQRGYPRNVIIDNAKRPYKKGVYHEPGLFYSGGVSSGGTGGLEWVKDNVVKQNK